MNARGSTAIGWPLVLVMVTGIYGYWAVQRELVSSRPANPSKHDVPDPIPSPGVFTLHSRIWEDPLSASYEDWKQLPSDEKARISPPIRDGDVKPYLEKAVQERWSARTRSQTSVETSVTSIYAWIRQLVALSRADSRQRARQQLFQVRVDTDPSWTTICLPVFVPGSPYAEEKERRMRTRYSVVSALAESGFALKYGSRMSYVDPTIYVRVFNGWQERQIVVPVKLYKNPTTKTQIMVLWINESELGQRPLLATHRLLAELFENVKSKNRLRVAMIGPASSDTLELMAQETKHLMRAAEIYHNVWESGDVDGTDPALHWLISAYSKNGVSVLTGFAPLLAGPHLHGDPLGLFSPRATKTVDFEQNSLIQLRRVINTDAHLAKTLAEELQRRGALPGRVALITEFDTAYGRAMPETFRENFPRDTIFDIFHILRGVDGKVPGDDTDASESSRQQPSSSTELPKIVERQPEGRTQYDYLRRLRRRIAESEDVTAIGVIGTDVYDKLLVLRALKPHFPDSVFFTTDLDAIYNHADEKGHTRNLIIASHFDLSLGNALQTATPPFRDSYQTATFLAVRLAVYKNLATSKTDVPHVPGPSSTWEQPPKSEKLNQVPPLWQSVENGFSDVYPNGVSPVLHVVGRDRIHPLYGFDGSIQNEATDPVAAVIHPKLPPDTGVWHYFFVVLVALAAGGVTWGWLHFDGVQDMARSAHLPINRVVLSLVVLGVILFVWVLVRGLVGVESSPFFDGYSAWPRKIVHITIGLFAASLVAFVAHEVRVQLKKPGAAGCAGLASTCLGDANLVKVYILAGVLVFAGCVFVYELNHEFWAPAAVVFLGLAIGSIVLPHRQPDQADSLPAGFAKNLVCGGDLRRVLSLAVAVMVGLFLLRLVGEMFHDSHVGWHPISRSRGSLSRIGDWLVTVYVFGAVALLLSAVLFIQLWCREFANYAKRLTSPENPGGLQDDEVAGFEAMRQEFADEQLESGSIATSQGDATQTPGEQLNDYDWLYAVGKLTSVSGRVAPLLMALLFGFVIAYHPWLSPGPMPLSLLVLASVSAIVFVVSTLALRRHFAKQREEALTELQHQLWNLSELEAKRESTDEQPADQVESSMSRGDGTEGPAVAVQSIRQTDQRATQKKEPKHLKTILSNRKEKIEALSEGVFRPLNKSPIGWVFGGGATMAIVDLWIRWWAIGL